MPLPVITNVVRIAVRGQAPSGSNWANVLHCLKTTAGAPSGADITNLDTAIRRLYIGAAYSGGNNMLSACKTTCTTVDVTYTPLDGSSTSTVSALTAAGALTDDSLPSQTAEVVTIRTARRGRSYRGRVYLPPWTEVSSSASGTMVASTVTAILNQWVGAQAALVATNWTIGVASYLHSTFEAATGFTMDTRFDVQRRRK